MFKVFGENHNSGKSIFDINRKTTILIVEDDPLSSKLLETTLKKEDYSVCCVSTGEEGLSKAAEILPDVILLDVVLPDINGFEICRKLRNHKILSDVVIIITTSLHDRESRIKGMDAGADDFLTKPFDNDDLKIRMRSISKLNRYRRIIAERAKFEWVVESSEDGFVVLDENDFIVYLNPQAKLFLNLPMDLQEMPGEKFKQKVIAQYNLEPKEAWDNWMNEKNNTVARYFVRPETHMISSLWLQVECLEMPNNFNMGKIVRMKDVTNQKYSQARMRSFQSMIYHKLRTPMTSVLGGMEIISQHEKIDLSKQELREYFNETLSSLNRLYATIEDIFSHQEALSLTRLEDSLKISESKTLLSYAKDYLGLKSIRLKINTENNDLLVPLSKRAVEFIIIELLENSKKFHPNNDPNILIEIKSAGKNQVSIKVFDDGRTIPPENLNKVWSPYYQIEKIFTGNIAGMGLGLSSVATIVWGVGGTCSISNRTDKPGVIVEIILPVTN